MSVSPRWLYAKLVVVALLWGGTYVAGRQLADSLPFLVASALRYGVAALSLLVLLLAVEGGLPRLTRWQWRRVTVLGATGVFAYSAFFFSALSQIPASRAALIMATNPAWTALGAWAFLGDRWRPQQAVGVFIAVAGTWIVITRGDVTALVGALGAGEWLSLAAAFSWSTYTLLGRRLLVTGERPPSSLAATAMATLIGGAGLVLASLFQWPQVRWDGLGLIDLWAALYMGVLATALAFVWCYDGVKAIGAARTAVFNNLVPAFAVILAAVLLGEAIETSMLLGGLVTIAGVWLTNKEA
ncbi:MAG: DMT family transporter [Burkholderiaceae bacterium]